MNITVSKRDFALVSGLFPAARLLDVEVCSVTSSIIRYRSAFLIFGLLRPETNSRMISVRNRSGTPMAGIVM